jgi:hypothetical protein
MVEKTEPQAVEKIKAARLSGFWQPIGLLVIVLGAFAITISLTTYQNQFLNILIPVALGLAYLTITTIFLVKRVKNALAIGAAILFSLALGALVSTEVAIAGFSIAGGLGIVYLIGAPILVVVLSKWAFSNKPDLVETAVEDTEPTIA